MLFNDLMSSAPDPQDIHRAFLKEKLLSAQRDLHEAKRDLAEVEARVKALSESVDYYNGVLIVAEEKDSVIKAGKKNQSDNGIQAKDLMRESFEDKTVKEAAQQVIDQASQPIDVDAIAEKIYDIRTEEESQLVKRSLAPELRRGAKAGLWEKTGVNEFASNTRKGVDASSEKGKDERHQGFRVNSEDLITREDLGISSPGEEF